MTIPAGFVPITKAGPFAEANGPLFVRASDATLGFEVTPAHCNPVGLCHGGWLGTFLDMQMPMTALRGGGLEGRFLVTVNLSLDFLAGAKVGSWVEGQATVLRQTGSLVFIQGLALCAGTPLLRGSGVYKSVPKSG